MSGGATSKYERHTGCSTAHLEDTQIQAASGKVLTKYLRAYRVNGTVSQSIELTKGMNVVKSQLAEA